MPPPPWQTKGQVGIANTVGGPNGPQGCSNWPTRLTGAPVIL